jgi:hypothetical protein
MRTSVAAVVVVLIVMASGLSFAQSGWWGANTYHRCLELAARQGLNAKSAGGRRFVNRCMQSDTYGRGDYRPSRNCPDDPKARSAYPAWMCP